MDKPLWMWAVFLAVVLALMVLDLGILHRKQRTIGVKESLLMSAFYIFIGVCFGGWIWAELGITSAQEYFTGFIVEKTLAMDNIFVISLIFSYFSIPRHLQHRVLFWGILGVIMLRGLMIGLGAALVAEFEWVLYIFAAFLVFTGVKMLFVVDHMPDINQNPLLRWMRKHLRITSELHGNKFITYAADPKSAGKERLFITPLLVALILIEIADVIFAVDSIPAIFAITLDPYIVYTSNIFAILGLRALYFALDAIIHRFAYLKQALALVLIFIGSKVFLADLFGVEKIPISISLTVTFMLLGCGIVYSLFRTRGESAGK